MKDSEFIQLLNLYLDHEISAADAARLEAEVQGNAARHRLYRDYCRMQKACKILAQDFAEDAQADADRQVVAFPTSNRSVGWYVAGTLAAAAACVAVVFVSHSRPQHATPNQPTFAQTSAPAKQAVATVNASDRPGIVRGTVNDLSLRHTDPNLALATAAHSDPHFAWMENVRLTPLEVTTTGEPINLNAAPSPKLDDRPYASGNRTLPSDVRWTAVRFQR